MEKENEVLSLAMTAERFGQRPSALVGIDDDLLALDFDRVCAFRLLLQDFERAQKEAEAIKEGSN